MKQSKRIRQVLDFVPFLDMSFSLIGQLDSDFFTLHYPLLLLPFPPQLLHNFPRHFLRLANTLRLQLPCHRHY